MAAHTTTSLVPPRSIPSGRERYALAARYFTGSDLDLEDTYAFGWDELHRIEDRMRRSASRSPPGRRCAR